MRLRRVVRLAAFSAISIVAAAAGFVVNSGYNGAIPSAALNVIWMGIGLFALAHILRRRPADG